MTFRRKCNNTCTERKPGCHAKCPKYHEDQVELEKLKAANRRGHEADQYRCNAIADYKDAEAKRHRKPVSDFAKVKR